MSHFTVGVIVKNKEKLDMALAPYSECDPNYYEREVYMSKEEYIDNYKYRNPDTDLSDDDIWAMAKEDYDDIDEDTIYSNWNPEAKYDWYELGGRWSGELKIKPNAEYTLGGHYNMFGPRDTNAEVIDGRLCVDGAKIKDIDWAYMNTLPQEEIDRLSKFWDGYVLGNEPDKDWGYCYKPEYYKEMYNSRDDFINKRGIFTTHDLLFCPEDSYQEWLTQGDMGWFGMDASTQDSIQDYTKQFYDIINDPEYQDYWFIIVDCHI